MSLVSAKSQQTSVMILLSVVLNTNQIKDGFSGLKQSVDNLP